MTSQVFGKQQFFDDNGDPLSGGLIYFYSPGTSTPKDTYSNYAGTVANTNPVVLDSRGEAEIWGNGLYDVIVKTSSDVLIYSLDNVGSDFTTDASSTKADLSARTDYDDVGYVVVLGRETVGDGGEGVFVWVTGDQSANVAADRLGGVWIAPDSDATGESGAWKRVFSGPLKVEWFGVSDLDGEYEDYNPWVQLVSYSIENGYEIDGLNLSSREYVVSDDNRIYDQNDQRFDVKGVALFDYLFVSFESRTTYNIRPGHTDPLVSYRSGYSRVQWVNPSHVENMIQRVIQDGCNTIRVGVDACMPNTPAQAAADGKTYPSDMEMLDMIIYYATKHNLVVLLRQGRKDATAAEFGAFMAYLYGRYSKFKNVWYNPENEINAGITNDTATWATDIATYLDALRDAGCATPIVINATQYGGQAGLVACLPVMDANATISGDPALVIGFHVYQTISETEGFITETRQDEQEEALYQCQGRYCIFIEEVGISNNLTGGIDPILDDTSIDDADSALFKNKQLEEWMREYMRWVVKSIQEGNLSGCMATTYGAYIPGSAKHDANSMRVFGNWSDSYDDYKRTVWGGIFIDYFLKTSQVIPSRKADCILEIDGVSLTLNRKNGSNIVINHRPESIPASGVTLSSSGVTVDTLYYCYAYLDSNKEIAIIQSATAPVYDPVSGMWVRTESSQITGASNPRYDNVTHTLVGMIYKVAAGWKSTQTQRLVRSLYNEPALYLLDSTGSDSTYSGVNSISGFEIECLLWADEYFDVHYSGGHTVNIDEDVSLQINDNGSACTPVVLVSTVASAKYLGALTGQVGGASDAYHVIRFVGGTVTNSTTIYSGARISGVINH